MFMNRDKHNYTWQLTDSLCDSFCYDTA